MEDIPSYKRASSADPVRCRVKTLDERSDGAVGIEKIDYRSNVALCVHIRLTVSRLDMHPSPVHGIYSR